MLDGCDTFPDEDAVTRQRRNEPAYSGLQSQTSDEHYGDSTADGGDKGIEPLRLIFRPAEGLPATLSWPSDETPRR